MRYHLTGLLLLMTPAAAVAQLKIVSPRICKHIAGSTSNAFPFSGAASIVSQRYLSIHDDMQGTPGVIKGLSVRVDEDNAAVPCTCNIELRISTAAVTGATATTTYDTNHGADKVTVIPPSTPINFPAVPATTPGPTPFTFHVPFTTPFTFLGAGGIAWEALVDSRVLTAASQMDAATGQAAFNYYGVNFGTGCIATGRTGTATSSGSYAVATGVTLGASQMTNSAPGGFVLGLSNTTWLGLTLPLDLPGTTGYPSGTCRVYTDWVVEQPTTSSATGSMSLAFPLTLGPATYGVSFFHYAYCLDTAANALNLITSNARKVFLGDGATIGGCRVSNNNNNAATTGTKTALIVVTEFWY